MASISAVHALLEGQSAWDAFRASTTGRIDLSLATLDGADLRGRRFEECDLAGASFVGANLDECVFRASRVQETTFDNASLVSCLFEDLDGERVSMIAAVLRDAKIRRCRFVQADLRQAQISGFSAHESQFDEADFGGAVITHSSFRSVSFDASHAALTKLRSCKLAACNVVSAQWPSMEVVRTSLHRCTIRSTSLSDAVLTDSAIRVCVVDDVDFTGVRGRSLDLSGSTLRRISLAPLDLPTAVMLDTSVASCSWPEQRGRVTLSGRYVPSAHLLLQPVQDIKGIGPSLRRTIADAQYLRDQVASARTMLNRIGLRCWGFTCAYGQSVLRLTLFAALVLVVLTVLLLAVRDSLADFGHSFAAQREALNRVFWAFAGLEPNSPRDPSSSERAILTAARMCGFVVLGLWIGVAANRLGRLSSD